MIGAILLAAGRSQRMGTQKLLLPFGPGQTVIGHITRQLLASPIDLLVVVVGATVADAVRHALAEVSDQRLQFATNPDADGDMLSSVRVGLRSLPPECDAALAALGDQPRITSALVAQMIQAFEVAGCGIVVPLHVGRRGHPTLFSLRYREEVLTSYDAIGLRGLLAAHPEDVFEVEVQDAWVLSDMDYPDDYRRELRATRTK